MALSVYLSQFQKLFSFPPLLCLYVYIFITYYNENQNAGQFDNSKNFTVFNASMITNT